VSKLRNNVMFAKFVRADGSTTGCNAFFPRKSVMLIPRHVFYPSSDMTKERTPRMEVTLHRSNTCGGKFRVKIDKTVMYDIPNLDLVACYVPNCPDIPSVEKFMLNEMPSGSSAAVFYHKTDDGSSETEKTMVKMSHNEGHCYMKFKGGHYACKISGKGSCMAPVIRDGHTPKILGFHVGGQGATYAVFQTLLIGELESAYAALEKLDGVMLSARTGVMPESQYGRPVVTGPVHPKAHVNTYSADQFVDVLGSCKVRRTQKSEVQTSVLSEAVTEVTGVENIWGPPKLDPNWKAFNATLDKIVDPADMFWPEDLQRARQDWLEPLTPLVKNYAKKNVFRPLTEHEMVCGIDGCRFIDALPMNTSMGFPIFGKKHMYFEEERDGEKLVTRHIGPEVKTEMDRLMACWKKGERGYPVFSACLKDEPTKLTKEKVRVFTAAPVAFGLYIRKFFLPIARFLSMYPRESEVAVGINAMSPQWQQLMDHSERFANGDFGHFGMDYSAYDTRMNSQMTRDNLVSMIQLAIAGGYPEWAILIMKTMIVDFCHPVIEYNGTIIVLYNMNTSGNNITVQINCLGNSKFVRMCFFAAVPEAPSFRGSVALTTYGDDNKGSVAKNVRKRFNFLTIRDELAKHGMKITPPDKDAEGQEFFPLKDLDFLKRQSVYHHALDLKLGALDENSIWKSLHCNLKSKTASPKEVAIGCLEGASHEWFAHERDTYEERMRQLREVAEKCELPVPALHYSFDERINVWREKYLEL
jgi:hypothetical protein